MGIFVGEVVGVFVGKSARSVESVVFVVGSVGFFVGSFVGVFVGELSVFGFVILRSWKSCRILFVWCRKRRKRRILMTGSCVVSGLTTT